MNCVELFRKRRKYMPVSESQKKANEKYNKNSTKQVTIRLINKEYELYEQYCKEHNKTKSGLLRERIADIIHSEE